MAGFSPNLDAAEFCLPSDIYPSEFPTIFSTNSTTDPTPEFPSESKYMQELAEQLAENALRDNFVSQHTPKPPPNFPQFGPVFPLQNGFGRGGYQYRTAFGRGGGFRPGLNLIPVFPVKPYPVQLESFVQGRPSAWPRQQQNPVRGRSVPVRSNNGPARGGRGTGVFLPRALVLPETRKKPTMKKTEQAPPGRNAGKQGMAMAFQRPPPHRNLPHDWPY